MDIASQWLAGILGLIPPMPSNMDAVLNAIAAGGSWLGSTLAPLGALVPFSSMTMVLQWWLGSLAFWLAMAGLRAALWVLGR